MLSNGFRVGILASIFAAGFALPAMATPTIYTLTVGATGFPSGPYGTVSLTQDGSNVDVVVTPASGMGIVDTGSHQAFDFYLSIPPVTSPITITGLPTGWTAENTPTTGPNAGKTSAGSISNAFAGTFNFALDCNTTACGNGGGHPDKTGVSFTVDNVVVSDFTKTPDGAYYFAADVCTLVNSDGACSGSTGPVAGNTPGTPGTSVPEPLTLSVFGAGLAGAAALRRRKRA